MHGFRDILKAESIRLGEKLIAREETRNTSSALVFDKGFNRVGSVMPM